MQSVSTCVYWVYLTTDCPIFDAVIVVPARAQSLKLMPIFLYKQLSYCTNKYMFWTEEREQLKDSNNRIFSGLFGRLGNSELCRKGPRSYDWDSNGSEFTILQTEHKLDKSNQIKIRFCIILLLPDQFKVYNNYMADDSCIIM